MMAAEEKTEEVQSSSPEEREEPALEAEAGDKASSPPEVNEEAVLDANTEEKAPSPPDIEVNEGGTATAVEDPEEGKAPFWNIQPRTLVVITVGILVCVLIPVVVFVAQKSSEEPNWRQQRLEKYDEIRNELRVLVPGITQDMLSHLRAFRRTPQRAAYYLAHNDPLWETYPDWRKQQRYAMGCLWFDFRFYNFRFGGEPTTHSHECDWRDDKVNNESVASCDAEGRVLALYYRERTWVKDFDRSRLPLELSFLTDLRLLDFSKANFSVSDEPSQWDDDIKFGTGDRARDYWEHPALKLLLPVDPDQPNQTFLPSLKTFIATDCTGLKGHPLPSQIGLLTGLELLDLSNSRIGQYTYQDPTPIPSQLGQLTNLQSLDLSYNDMTDAIPSQLGRLKNLTSLWLQSNGITGTLPSTLADLPLLETFQVQDNYLDQYLPPGLCPMEDLATDWCWGEGQCCGR